MSEEDLKIVCSKIEEEKHCLNCVSQEIWKLPELQFKEVQAHALLTCALRKRGFKVEKHYFMPTAFRAEYTSSEGSSPTVAILLEYDALPEIGHACGHNLIAEAGLAAAIGIKAVMEENPTLQGKVVVLGTPAEEGGGGKIQLLDLGAFDGIDAALMAHPAKRNIFFPVVLSNVRYSVVFKGAEAHSAANPWDGLNALDAAVSCYQNLAFLRQHIKPEWRICTIIKKGGTAVNIIPSEACMEVQLRTTTRRELRGLQAKAEACFRSAAAATGCEVHFQSDESNTYESLITNRVLGNLFTKYCGVLGMDTITTKQPVGSTDMGNVSHVLPAIHPLFNIGTDATNHSKEYTEASGSPRAQPPTLTVAKALAMTALQLMRSPETMEEVRRTFREDMESDTAR